MRNKRIIGNTNDQYCNISGCQCIDHAVGYQYFTFYLINNNTRDLKLGMHTHTPLPLGSWVLHDQISFSGGLGPTWPHLFLWGGRWVPHGQTSSSGELGPTWPDLFFWGLGPTWSHLFLWVCQAKYGSWVKCLVMGWVVLGNTTFPPNYCTK